MFVVVRRSAWKTRAEILAPRRHAAREVDRRRRPLAAELRGRGDARTIGSICVSAAALPVDEILNVADAVVVRRPDTAVTAA
jgi:hypothetical protein